MLLKQIFQNKFLVTELSSSLKEIQFSKYDFLLAYLYLTSNIITQDHKIITFFICLIIS